MSQKITPERLEELRKRLAEATDETRPPDMTEESQTAFFDNVEDFPFTLVEEVDIRVDFGEGIPGLVDRLTREVPAYDDGHEGIQYAKMRHIPTPSYPDARDGVKDLVCKLWRLDLEIPEWEFRGHLWLRNLRPPFFEELLTYGMARPDVQLENRIWGFGTILGGFSYPYLSGDKNPVRREMGMWNFPPIVVEYYLTIDLKS